VINPGGAFGTGRHETTWLCLELVEELIAPGMRVADIGSGSGVLGIAAAKLGAASVLAVDLDPAAIDATRENALTNGVAARVDAIQASLPPAGGTLYDLVVANTYSDTLIAISERLVTMMTMRASLVLSGIEAVRTAEVEAAFVGRGLRLDEKRVRGEWSALVFRRPSA
jgi:ribosomal protein L11 methyltransferase